MRTRLFLALGALEIAAAAALVLTGFHLPDRAEVERTFGSARQMTEIAGRHTETLERQMDVVQDGARGLHQTMRTLSGALEQTAGLQYPNVTLDGLRPRVEWRQLWPEGQEQAARFQRVVESAGAAAGQVDELAHDLPLMRENLQQMNSALEQYGRQTAQALWYGRLLMWLVAAIVALHGGHRLVSAWWDEGLDKAAGQSGNLR